MGERYATGVELDEQKVQLHSTAITQDFVKEEGTFLELLKLNRGDS